LSASCYLIQNGADDAAMKNARIPLEMRRSRIRRLDCARRGFVEMQVKAYGILQSADKAHSGIGLLDAGHGLDSIKVKREK
jgi:hypothetical protein